MNAQDLRNHVSQQCGFTPNKAKQGEIPDSFEAWLKSNQDSIPLDRTESCCRWFDELPKQLPF